MFLEDLGNKRYFRVQRYAFAAIGIDINTPEHIVKNFVMGLIPFVGLTSLCLAILHYTVHNIADVDKVTDALSFYWQGFMSIWKFSIFIWKRKDMAVLVRRIWTWNLNVTAEERAIIARENGKDVMFCTFYITAVALTGSTALIAPFIIVALMRYSDGAQEVELLPPLRASYFVDYRRPINYIFIHAWNCVCIYAVMHISVSIDGLFSWFMNNIIAQFRILQLRLKQVTAAAEKTGQDVPAADISACVHLHRRIMDTADELNTVFGAIIFVKFTISCLQICVLAYQVSRGGEIMDDIFHGLFILSVATQLILYCQGGQLIKDESEMIATSIYSTFQWYNYRVPTQKLLLYSMVRSQRGCNLSGIFFAVDLSLYVWVFRTAGSYIALLWNIDDQE